MPWARLPPDRLFVLPLFGINLLKEEADFLWYDMPGKGAMRVQKSSPRIWFDSTSDAHQAGARGVLLTQTERLEQETADAAASVAAAEEPELKLDEDARGDPATEA